MALERLGSSMLTIVTGQFIWSGKLPATTFPRAFIRLLSRVRPLVCLQVRALGVHLVTVVKVTLVNASPLEAALAYARVFRCWWSHLAWGQRRTNADPASRGCYSHKGVHQLLGGEAKSLHCLKRQQSRSLTAAYTPFLWRRGPWTGWRSLNRAGRPLEAEVNHKIVIVILMMMMMNMVVVRLQFTWANAEVDGLHLNAGVGAVAIDHTGAFG